MNQQYISLPVYALVKSKDYDLNNHSIYKVKSPTYNNHEIYISTEIIEESASFSDKFIVTEKVNKHQLAEKLVYSNGTIFTIEFEKVNKAKRTVYHSKLMSLIINNIKYEIK